MKYLLKILFKLPEILWKIRNQENFHIHSLAVNFNLLSRKANTNKIENRNLEIKLDDFNVTSQKSQVSSLRNARDGVLTIYQDLRWKKYLEDSPEWGDSSNSEDDPSNVRYIEQRYPLLPLIFSQVKIYNDVEQDSVKTRMGSLSNSRWRQLSEIHSSQGESSLKRSTHHFLPASMSSGK